MSISEILLIFAAALFGLAFLGIVTVAGWLMGLAWIAFAIARLVEGLSRPLVVFKRRKREVISD